MPRYFFDIHDGAHTIDDDGTELSGVDEARVAAAQLAGTMLADDPEKFWSGEAWQVVVRDEAGQVLFGLMFLAQDATAASTVRRPGA